MDNKKPKQVMRFSDAELSVIKNTFVEADEVLKALRKFMLQLPLTVADKSYIEILQSKPEVLAVIRKAFLPELEGDAPLHQMVDLWMTVEIKDKGIEGAWINMRSRKILIDFLEQQLSLLEGKKKKATIKFEDLSAFDVVGNPEDGYVKMLARNTAIGHTDMQLNQFLVLAGRLDETIEQTKERLRKDSTK